MNDSIGRDEIYLLTFKRAEYLHAQHKAAFSLVIKDRELRLNLQLNITAKKALVYITGAALALLVVIKFIIEHHEDFHNLLN